MDKNLTEKGKFIVIDGTNGSGKATQTKKLVKKLKSAGYKILIVDFPRYGKRSATLIEDYLKGKFGTTKEVGPYRASIFYACDRYAASFSIRQHLNKGGIVIANRYTPSNMAHQTSILKGRREKDKFLKWITNLEYKTFQIPEPDLVIILYNPPGKSQKWVDKKGFRQYLKAHKRDIHEADIAHLKAAAQTYKSLSKKYIWPLIKADQDIEIVHKEIMKYVSRILAKNRLD